MSPYDDEILLMTLDMAVGDRSPHLVCPQCLGGPDKRESLVIWCDAGKVVAKCYGVRCAFLTIIGETAPRKMSSAPRNKRTDATRLAPVVVPDDVSDFLYDLFPWLEEQDLALHGVMWEDRLERVLIPIKSLTGTDEGYLARLYKPLCLDERNEGGPKCKGWYWPGIEAPSCMLIPRQFITDTLVLAEDWWSALRISKQVPCIALSGTSIGDAALLALMRRGIKHVIIVLDADAVATASKMVQANSLLFTTLRMVPLRGKDPKDMPEQEFQHLITQIQERLQ